MWFEAPFHGQVDLAEQQKEEVLMEEVGSWVLSSSKAERSQQWPLIGQDGASEAYL